MQTVLQRETTTLAGFHPKTCRVNQTSIESDTSSQVTGDVFRS